MKFIYCLSFAMLTSPFLYSQAKHKGINLEKINMGFSLEAALPIFNVKGSGPAAGTAFHLSYPVKEKISASFHAGYMRFSAKGKYGSGANYQYCLLGGNYWLRPVIHLDAFAGYTSFSGTYSNPFVHDLPFNNKTVGMGAGVGYRFTNKLDACLRFQKSGTLKFVALNLLVWFNNK